MKALRRAAVTLVGLLALAAGGLALAVWRIDADSIRDAIGARLEETVGQPVALGRADLALWPSPAARIRDLRVGLGPELRISAPELRVELSLLPLLADEIVLRALELEEPRLESTGVTPTSDWKRGAAERVRFAITRLGARDGTIALGGLALERVTVRAALEGAATPALEFSAEIPGVGRMAQGRLEATDRSGPIAGWAWQASAELEQIDLSELGKRLLLPEVFGSARGTWLARGRGIRPEQAKLTIESADFTARGGFGSALGHARLELDLARAVTLDLGGAVVRLLDSVEKPSGAPLRVTGQWGERDGVRGLHDAVVESGPLRGTGKMQVADRTAILEVQTGSVDLTALAAWKPAEWVPRGGRLEIQHGRLSSAPLALDAAGVLSRAALLWHGVTFLVSGPVSANGTSLSSDGVTVELAGEALAASGRYDWRARQLELDVGAKGPRIGPIAAAAWGRKDVSGRLYGQMRLTGTPALGSLAGQGEFEILDGEIANIALARPAGLIKTVEEPPGLDLFDRLSGRFELRADRIQVLELSLFQKYAAATVTGEIELPDWYANMTGAVLFSYPELSGPSLRPILRMAGPIYALETHISNARSADELRVESATIEAIRKAEKEQRERKKAGAQKTDG